MLSAKFLASLIQLYDLEGLNIQIAKSFYTYPNIHICHFNLVIASKLL